MRFLQFIIPYIFFLSSCVGGSSTLKEESAINSKGGNTDIKDIDSTLSDQEKEDSEPILNSDTVATVNNVTEIVKSNTDSKKEQTIGLSKDEIIQIGSQKAKPPKISKQLVWTKDGVKINYRRKVYPDPNIGCSESFEELTLIIPTSDKQDTMKIESPVIRNSRLSYSYSGGLYSESAKGKPLRGSVKLNKVSPEKWQVDIEIQFVVEIFGEMQNNKEVKSYKLSERF